MGTYYALPGVLDSLALIINRGKRMENKQPLWGREAGRENRRCDTSLSAEFFFKRENTEYDVDEKS